ncbi:unnamed protein product [Nezara viridula]|uniref:Uncharacterized protein n=1 Tax=Nezara viridula TaxID=85310 RepID=A0A9P0E993_NEZVI|nr:unnamed protein product [Nezara viridula]
MRNFLRLKKNLIAEMMCTHKAIKKPMKSLEE